MSDFDSTDFDSSSGEADQKAPAARGLANGTYEYPPYIQLQPLRLVFQQQEYSYREKQVNLLIRDKNISTQSDTVSRPQQTFIDQKRYDKGVQAPALDPRDGLAVLLRRLQIGVYSCAETAVDCLKQARTVQSYEVRLQKAANAKAASVSHDFTFENAATQPSSSVEQVLTCRNYSATFSFGQGMRITDFAIYSPDKVVACSDAGFVVLALLPHFGVQFMQNCGRRLVAVSCVQGYILALAIDGSIRKITELGCDVLCQDRAYIGLGVHGERGFVKTMHGAFLLFDNSEQLRSGDYETAYYLEGSRQQ